MGVMVQGIPASPGIVIGPAVVVSWPNLQLPHATVSSDSVEPEIARFHGACEAAKQKTVELRDAVEKRLGAVPAKIFDPQLMMLEDPELIDEAVTYISDSFLTAERAFSLRILEFRSQWLETTHARLVDRIADLNDVQYRVLAELVELGMPANSIHELKESAIVVAHELTPSRIVELDRDHVIGVATDVGTRTAHASILARSLDMPAVVGLADLSRRLESGTEIVLDGQRGQVIIEPTQEEKSAYQASDAKARDQQRELAGLVDAEPVTQDGTRIELQITLELPVDAKLAAAAAADGVGLFRTEFLVVGQSTVPDEEEQYEAFRSVVDDFAPRPVTIRTYDLGGDKFPLFLPPLAGENPFLGWRGTRLYREMPELFRNQVRAVMRAAARGPVKMLLPLVSSVDEVMSVRQVIASAAEELDREGVEFAECELGVMLETPAAIAIADVLGRHVDFFSLGTNDLAQYALAVDRGNAQLARFFDPYHPAILRFIRDAVAAARRQNCPLSVCGESTSEALGVLLLIGLGVRSLSCSAGAILEQKKLIRSLQIERVEDVASELIELETGGEIRARLQALLTDITEPSSFTTSTSLSHTE